MRRTPYTAIGIRRVPCMRCGAPGVHQWQICSLPGFHVVCLDCDIALNRAALECVRHPRTEDLMARYEAKVRRAASP